MPPEKTDFYLKSPGFAGLESLWALFNCAEKIVKFRIQPFYGNMNGLK